MECDTLQIGTIDGAATERGNGMLFSRSSDSCLSLVSALGLGRRMNDDAVWNAWWMIERGIAVQW